MINLAGHKEATAHVREELERCRIPVVEVEVGRSEVPSTLGGQLGPFKFTRAWYYYVVHGPVPLAIARELYADPVGRKDIRVAGHCGCPPPEHPWVEHYAADGFKLYKLKPSEEQVKDEATMDKYAPGWRDEFRCVEDPAALAVRSVVTSYHIDSELGLYIFARAVEGIA